MQQLATTDEADPGTIRGLKFATARDYSRPTLGTRQALFSKVWLRQPLMPVQRFIADLTGELLPNGLPAHSLVVVTGPRQMGKTHLELAQTGERCFTVPGFKAWYTAQTGGDAADQFLKFYDENIVSTPLENAVNVKRGNGHQVMMFPNKSQLRPHPPTEAALHGKQGDRNSVDEGWAFKREQGKALMQAISPTHLTRPGAQTFIWSAGGTIESTWLADLVARGREGDPTICYVELGIPDDLALDDLEAIAEHHPAYGHTITLDSIRATRAELDDDAEFARAVGNRWTEIIGGSISPELYKSSQTSVPIPDDAVVGYGAVTSADRTETVVVAAAKVGDLVVCEVVDVIARTYGAATRVAGWDDGPIAIDKIGPSAALAEGVSQTRAQLLDIGLREAQTAAANLLDGMVAGVVKFRKHPAFDGAVKVATKRSVGDGGFLWSRAQAGASVAALEAAGLAAYAVGHRKPTEQKPQLYFADSA